MKEHIGDDAALYALGTLNERDRARIISHGNSCAQCRQLLARAEDDVAAMAGAQAQLAAPSRLRERLERSTRRTTYRHRFAAFGAVAAVLLLAALPSVFLLRQNQSMSTYADVIQRIATSPHRTASFTDSGARVVYGSNGSWYCIIVRGPSSPMRVAWMHHGKRIILGTTVQVGNLAMLYLPKSHTMHTLALLKGRAIIGQAKLAF
jgi:hypothetical protein